MVLIHRLTSSNLSKQKILKISGIDGICHYHSGLEIVFICVHYSICHVKTFKSQFAMSNFAFFLNFFIMGVWHGLELFYIVYGIYHGLMFIGYGYYERWRKETSTTLAKWFY